MSSLSLKESILDSFASFFQRLASNHPQKDELLQNLSAFQQMILSDNSDYIQTKIFISSLYQKGSSKSSQAPTKQFSQVSVTEPLHILPGDVSLKVFSPEKLRSPFSLLTKFTYASFKDYLTKNLIFLPVDSPLLYKYTNIREFLPDSQNFYRVIGLSLIEMYLSDITYLPRLTEWYNKVFYRELMLSSHIYSFPAEELRSTFCGYLKQLIETRMEREETKEGHKSRTLLFNMDCKDSIFDISLVSFIKEMLIQSIDISKQSAGNLEGRIKANDSTLIEDLIGEISHTFNVNLIVQVVQNKIINEVIYAVQSYDPSLCPTLHVLNEKQLSYQNFSILNTIPFEETCVITQKESISHTRNPSLPHTQSSVNPKLEKAFSIDSKPTYEKGIKVAKPSHVLSKRASLPEATTYEFRNIIEQVPDTYETNDQQAEIAETGFFEEDAKPDLNKELSPKQDLLSLSKILGALQNKTAQEETDSIRKLESLKPSFDNIKEDFSNVDILNNKNGTPQKGNEDNNSNSPFKFHISPLNLDLTPATKLQEESMKVAKDISPHIQQFSEFHDVQNEKLFGKEENFIQEKQKEEQEKMPLRVIDIEGYSNISSSFNKAKEEKNNNKTFEFQKPKIVTMIPKFMSSVPYNPFSMGPSQFTNPMNAFSNNVMSSQESYSKDKKEILKTPQKIDTENNPMLFNPSRRFSLNPLAALGQNIENIERKSNNGENFGRNLRMSGQS